MDNSKKKLVEMRRKQADRIRRYRAKQVSNGLAAINLWLPLPMRDRIKTMSEQKDQTLSQVITDILKDVLGEQTTDAKIGASLDGDQDVKPTRRRGRPEKQRPQENVLTEPEAHPVATEDSSVSVMPKAGRVAIALETIAECQKNGMTIDEIADELNKKNIATTSGRGKWHKAAVLRVMQG